jgi:putative oxidoreductase
MMRSDIMPTASLGALSRALAALPAIERLGGSALLLLFRLWMAKIFWDSGMRKLDNWSITTSLFTDVHPVPLLSPEVAATLATAVELGCPILLLIGLATRFAAIPMLGMALTIQFLVPDFYRIEHYYWMMLLVSLMVFGGGLFSADHWIRKHFHIAERS